MNESLCPSAAGPMPPLAGWPAADDGDGADPPGDGTAEAPRGTAGPALDDGQLATLIEHIARQDERAPEALYDATGQRVHALALRLMRNRASAEEVVEDCHWQVWRQAARFDAERGHPMTWLLAMARSRAIDALRHDQRFQHDRCPWTTPSKPPPAPPRRRTCWTRARASSSAWPSSAA